jgi:hypothetical protein
MLQNLPCKRIPKKKIFSVPPLDWACFITIFEGDPQEREFTGPGSSTINHRFGSTVHITFGFCT